MEAFTEAGSVVSIRSDSARSTKSLKSRLKTVTDRYRRTKKYIKSKSVLMVFAWAFLVSLSYNIIANLGTYVVPLKLNIQYEGIVAISFPAILYIFYPIAGLLADIKISRYKAITSSLLMCIFGTPPALIGSGVLASIPELDLSNVSRLILVLLGVLLIGFGLLLLACSAVGFNANVIQFGLDQLHDRATEDHVIFIQWYLWIFFSVIFVINLIFELINFNSKTLLNTYYYILASIYTTIALTAIISLYIAERNEHWFVINPKVATNPYKLVLRVSKFAFQHKFPINRSAFTYCGDEVPSRLDLAKKRYGGPYTTEEVEDVKVFYGITKILIYTGAFFFLNVSAHTVTYVFKAHALQELYHSYFKDPDLKSKVAFHFIDGGILYTVEIVILYPIYIFLIRPFISYYIPKVFTRMGMGLLALIVSLLVLLGMDVFAHVKDREIICMFDPQIEYNIFETENTTHAGESFHWKIFYVTVSIEVAIIALVNIMMLSSIYEFIFSQSPQAMKGLFMGLCFAVQGTFRALGALFILPLVLYGSHFTMPSCGIVYYSANVVIGILSLLVFVYQARKYNYRKRDECCHYYRYAEEYISKVIEEDERLHFNSILK